MGTHQLDDIERGLLQALQIDGRVPFLLVGELLGVSDQTVAWRYARLRATHGARVTGTLWSEAVGQQQWLVRVRRAPEAAAGLARALARQDDTSWVRVASGGAEIVCMARMAADASAEDHAVLSRLPRTPRVTEVSALGQDGRAGYRQLAEVTGWSQTTVRRRLAELRRAGVLYFDVDIDHTLLGLRTPATLWLSVEPGQLVAAGEALARHPQVGFAAATTGPYNLYAGVACASTRALYEYLTGPIAALPGLRSVETAPIMRIFKQNSPFIN
ncbi:MAG TPA: AsnC family transcriptional regulator [Pseudonocardia sp.]|jgi:DNA-binding Lrp family transcriptional regulator|nr:AsnC family transcriptional regulator [Pseudonocardia sp.]